MHLEVTFRNLRARDEIRRRADALYAKLERFVDPAAEGTLVITHEHGVTITELTVVTSDGVHKAHDEDEDLRTALDRTFHKIENHLRRAKDKRIARRHTGGAKAEGFVPAGDLSDEDEQPSV